MDVHVRFTGRIFHAQSHSKWLNLQSNPLVESRMKRTDMPYPSLPGPYPSNTPVLDSPGNLVGNYSLYSGFPHARD
jgi:hypothetical protein